MRRPSTTISILATFFHHHHHIHAFSQQSSTRLSKFSTVSPSYSVPSSALYATATISSEEETITEVEEEDVEFPAPISNIERLQRSAKFWSNALIPIVASYFVKDWELQIRRNVLNENVTDDEVDMMWDETHAKGSTILAETITSLKGFYVKTAQIIASRSDLFPPQYTDALSGFTDNLDPMPSSLAKAVISKELLNEDEDFDKVFTEFDPIPLGSASVAQVHRAVLSAQYGGPKEVAIKVQRPGIESKLMGDIGNLKMLAKPFREMEVLPVDYYTVFSELEAQLAGEFDFVAEAVAMDRIYESVRRDGVSGRLLREEEMPLVMPRPVGGLVSRRVLVMDYLKGVPLSRAREEMIKKGIDPSGPESKLFGRKLLRALTDVFGRCIMETGFFHADPHPGNIFVLDDGNIGLIDFGQVKQISGRNRLTLAKVITALNDRKNDTNPSDLAKIGSLALELGVEIKENAPDVAPAAIAMWLFDGSVETLPGGYDKMELSPNSPLKELKSFPQDLTLAGRSTILIKGLSSRLGVDWSLSREWEAIARRVLEEEWGGKRKGDGGGRVRFRDVWATFKQWGKGKGASVVRRLPSPLRRRVVSLVLKIQERNERKQAQ